MTDNGNEQGPGARLRKLLCATDAFYYSTLWLLALLVCGTLAQRYVGLYLAQERYFSSWWIWVSGIPLPGGRLTMTIIFFNLVFRLLFMPFNVKRLGTFITHVGALLLFAGGFITAYFSAEGNMVIPEGQASGYYEDYHALEMAVVDQSHPDYDEVTAFSGPNIQTGAVLEHKAIPGRIRIIEAFENARIAPRAVPDSGRFRGFAQRFAAEPAPLAKEYSDNQPAVLFTVEGIDPDTDGTYLVYAHMPVPQSIRAGSQFLTIVLRPQRHLLPFAIELVDFEKTEHPGTRMAKSYKSFVNVIEGDLKRRVEIAMNKPLRQFGHTFYQASFIENGPAETTVLAVVHNRGRLFPYVSSIIMCIGLLVHLLLQIPKLIRTDHA